ncbi:hypothetical protein SAMD00019534_069370 [Acytostelium subglobosum LB1]|uniref:hypothetical protein n=1 Tax=Acytostelium subglobosum LB1 TaxID=1410327 RepID=UPI000644F8DF|nr:hypothetical protein SAMD00019534_069370 [Acytostelium subglobosum LB1]GAM23762.1 hypothetical protein SAMD00019534_069370 [Acytostelium subglobosum LB1]|eukprot:XP_012753503.1 hypothetical protein SAMD00019534_069370 [Acytostelium subglobosum LB1]
MSYNQHEDGNPFSTEEVPLNSTPPPSQQQPQQQQHHSQPQAIFTNTNINYDTYTRQPTPQQQLPPSTVPSTSTQSTAYQPDLQFQNKTTSPKNNNINYNNNSNNNSDRIGGVPPVDADYSTASSSNLNEYEPDTKTYSFYQPQYYRFLFNVDTVEVGHRLVRSMMPFKFSFFHHIRENPDLYGPWWTTITLIFVISVTANLNEYIGSNHSSWEVDFKKLVYSTIAILGYAFAIPLILWALFKWMKLQLRLLDMVCIYGYALFIFIPASVLCVVPIGIFQWVIVGLCTLVSGAFLVTNIFTPLKEDFTKRGLIICAGIAALHLGLGLLLKLYFFANNTDGKLVPTPSPTPTPTPSLTPTPTNMTTTA